MIPIPEPTQAGPPPPAAAAAPRALMAARVLWHSGRPVDFRISWAAFKAQRAQLSFPLTSELFMHQLTPRSVHYNSSKEKWRLGARRRTSGPLGRLRS